MRRDKRLGKVLKVVVLYVIIWLSLGISINICSGANSLPPPVLKSPGSISFPGPKIETLTPTFEWEKASEADYYALYIRDLCTDTFVFNSESEGIELTGTSYKLPIGILKYGKLYRWNMRSYEKSTGWSDFSNKLYFHTGAVFGIDVSHNQGNINWSKVYGAGYRFAFVKATQGGNNTIITLPEGSEGEILDHKYNNVFVNGYHWWYVKFNVKSLTYVGWIVGEGIEKIIPDSREFAVGDKVRTIGKYNLRNTPEITREFTDDKFTDNMKKAIGVGTKEDPFLVGPYHYAEPNLSLEGEELKSDAENEALHFIKVAENYLRESYLMHGQLYGPALDIENDEGRGGIHYYTATGEKIGYIDKIANPNILGKEKTTQRLSEWVNTWVNTIERWAEKHKLKVKPIIYTGYPYGRGCVEYLDKSIAEDYDLWIAAPGWGVDWSVGKHDIGNWAEKGWAFWQFYPESPQGSVEGIDAKVDLDVFNGDMARLREFIITLRRNVDVVLVIDRSGSMGEMMGDKTKMKGAKEAAIGAVNTLLTGDKVGVISFSDFATQNVHLTSDFNYAIREIEKLSEGGRTSFGAGLSLALQEFETNGRKDSPWATLFLSDGWHNTAPDPEAYVDKCKTLGIPVYTIGLGNTPADVNENLLKWMAEETGGKYLFAPSLHDLQNIFIRFSLEATGYKISAEFSGIISAGQTVTAGTFEVKPNTERIRITLNWQDSDLDLMIIRPDSKEVDLTADPDIIYSGSVAKPEWVILLSPQTGTWTVKVYGREITSPQEKFTVWISTYEAPPLPKIDKTPPTTTLTIGEPKYGNTITYVTPETTFVLSATDNVNGTGVAKTAYRIYNLTYSSKWLIYVAPFHLTNLTEGAYNIDYNSTDNAGNVEPTNTTAVILFSWNYIFKDSFGRNTTLKINIAHKFFQFMTPEKDYGIRNATYLELGGRTITIKHYDNELRIITTSLDTKLDFCVTIAWDVKTRTRYFLIDKIGIED